MKSQKQQLSVKETRIEMSFLSEWILAKVLPPSHWLAFSLSPSWQKLTLTIWKEGSVSSIIQIFESLILVLDPDTPLCQWWPCLNLEIRAQNALKHLCLVFFYFKEFYFLLLYFWCNIVQIHLAELFINWNKVTEHRSAWASSFHLKH